MVSPRVPEYKYRELFGRAFNAHKDNYVLPADDLEHARLDIQHEILRYSLGNSLYEAPDLVRNALKTGQTERPKVLDIGTGSGRWALEMAIEFPHADVIGIDLAPPKLADASAVPPNCRFEVRDANLLFDDYKGLFDVVHCRCIELGIVNFHGFLFNVAQALKPGGVLLLCSGYAQLFDEKHEPLPVTVEGDPKFTWIQRAAGEVYAAVYWRKDNAMDAQCHWNEWLRENPNYELYSTHDHYLPIGPWPSDLNEPQTYAAELMRYNLTKILYSWKPIFQMEGIPAEEIDRMIKCTTEELRQMKAHAHARWAYACAIRSEAPWSGMPEHPVRIGTSPSVVLSEEYLRAKASRSAGKIIPPSSVV
ncbi:hypothetical protein FRC03_009672 [Tulasnella sp. 419]|nr:hypothetical protein FRC02_009203 [Tulasnella sp. 418]KAG8957951.1 hypothetical protein FRC03_009672 [Tulasnella sp. 419]